MEQNEKKKVGRPPKQQENSNVENKQNNKVDNNDLLIQIEELKKIIAQMQKTPVKQDKVIRQEEDEVIIRPDKYIKVMSLNFGLLNLTTMPKGQGKIFSFNKFGDVKNIVYADLSNVIHNHQNFAEEGRFYIFNQKVIENHGLTEFYEKFLNKDKIEQILDFDKEQMVDLFKNATKTQQETIVQILIKKIKNGEDIDLNKTDVISRLYGSDIYQIANEYKQEE